jgi:hypothetical protein
MTLQDIIFGKEEAKGQAQAVDICHFIYNTKAFI